MSGLMPGESQTGIVALYRSAGHNFVGHHGIEPGTHRMDPVSFLDCRAGRGVMDDRYFDHRSGYKGQITFFAWEVHRAVCAHFGRELGADVYRRNVITRGVDLSRWIGVEFELQGMRFEGVEECRPCYWMDRAVAEGAEEFLRGRGGLRARILGDGQLTVDLGA
jgi:MOSC domain-containing protein YiiM